MTEIEATKYAGQVLIVGPPEVDNTKLFNKISGSQFPINNDSKLSTIHCQTFFACRNDCLTKFIECHSEGICHGRKMVPQSIAELANEIKDGESMLCCLFVTGINDYRSAHNLMKTVKIVISMLNNPNISYGLLFTHVESEKDREDVLNHRIEPISEIVNIIRNSGAKGVELEVFGANLDGDDDPYTNQQIAKLKDWVNFQKPQSVVYCIRTPDHPKYYKSVELTQTKERHCTHYRGFFSGQYEITIQYQTLKCTRFMTYKELSKPNPEWSQTPWASDSKSCVCEDSKPDTTCSIL